MFVIKTVSNIYVYSKNTMNTVSHFLLYLKKYVRTKKINPTVKNLLVIIAPL